MTTTNPISLSQRIATVVAALSLAAGAALAQGAPPAAAAPPPERTGFDKFIHDSKEPTSWWKWSADLRIRNEYYDNIVTLREGVPYSTQNYQRYRARWANTITPVKELDFNVRLTWEGRSVNEWRGRAGSNYRLNFTGFDWQEGVLDNLNFKLKNPGELPLTLTIGRQDMMFGEGWLVLDGTPLDGSRTIYFDAARLTYELKEQKTTVDLIYIDQGGLNDRWLPPINHLWDRTQIEQDERGAILYVSNKSIKKTQLDGYLIYKHTDQVTTPLQGNGDNANLYTAGGRVVYDPHEKLRYRLEGAYQFGDKRDKGFAERDVSAFGINTALIHMFRDPRNCQARISYEYLSGDDPNTGKDEMFDLVWGRWPRWSELYIYSYINESRVAQIGNLHRVGPGLSFSPFKGADFSADYYLLFADQAVPTRAPASALGLFSRTGHERGQMIQAVLKYRYNEHIAGHLWAEFIFPGNYYTHSDLMQFLRAEIMFTW